MLKSYKSYSKYIQKQKWRLQVAVILQRFKPEVRNTLTFQGRSRPRKRNIRKTIAVFIHKNSGQGIITDMLSQPSYLL